MRLSLSSASLYLLPLRDLFCLAARAGCDGVELVMAPEVWVRGPRYVRRLASEFGVPVLSVHQSMLPFSPHGTGAARMRDALEAAQDLQCRLVVVHDPFVTRWEAREAQGWLRELERCQLVAEKSGIRLALENPGMYHANDAHNLFAQPWDLLSFVRRMDLEVTYDTCHAGSGGMEVSDAYEILRSRVANVHLSDLRLGEPPLGLASLRTLLVHHQMPGEGVLSLEPFIAQLVRDNYDGPLTMELSVVALRGWSATSARTRLVDALAFVRNAARCSGIPCGVAEPDSVGEGQARPK